MKTRMELHRKLVNILGKDNPVHVYFQPPENTKMTYPAIVYSIERYTKLHADNIPYKIDPAYSITVIDKDPESQITKCLLDWPMCSFNRHFTSDNLNHDVFILYNI